MGVALFLPLGVLGSAARALFFLRSPPMCKQGVSSKPPMTTELDRREVGCELSVLDCATE